MSSQVTKSENTEEYSRALTSAFQKSPSSARWFGGTIPPIEDKSRLSLTVNEMTSQAAVEWTWNHTGVYLTGDSGTNGLIKQS